MADPPYDVGTTTVTVRSRGNELTTTVAYPATSDGVDAEPVCRASRLVVAGHGAQGDGAAAARLHQFLVQAGYVVAAPTFPQAAGGGFDFAGNATDVSRTITKVRRLSAGDGLLAGRVKKKRVGYIGTSMGGIIGLQLVDEDGRDKRIKAVVAKAGRFYGTVEGKGGPGLLMINGNADTVISYDAARQNYREANRPKGFITLDGIGHDLNTGGDQILTQAPLGFFAHFLKGRKNGLKHVEKAAEDSKIASLVNRW